MKRLKQFLIKLLREDGHDIVEYTLILAFVCLASGALYVQAGNSVHGVWTTANTVLTAGNNGAGGGDLSQIEQELFGDFGQGFTSGACHFGCQNYSDQEGDSNYAFSGQNFFNSLSQFQTWAAQQGFSQSQLNNLNAWGAAVWGSNWVNIGHF